MHYDLFNGDADGICALHQLRLAEPRPDATLITGVKRDIVLLGRPELAKAENCTFTVLDVSLDSNREPLLGLLARDNTITYFDHHSADPIPDTPQLVATIRTSADTCTSLLVNEALNGAYPLWAICGAYGDNLNEQAAALAAAHGLATDNLNKLHEIGELFNYNGYGATIEDLHFHPLDLYRAISTFLNPLDFHRSSEELAILRNGYHDDLTRALATAPYPNSGRNRVYFFPDAAWARRVAGVFANLKAREKQDAAHALITENRDKTLRISVRAPQNDRRDAATLCKRFATGGGRAGSAGINNLPADQFDAFLAAFNATYP